MTDEDAQELWERALALADRKDLAAAQVFRAVLAAKEASDALSVRLAQAERAAAGAALESDERAEKWMAAERVKAAAFDEIRELEARLRRYEGGGGMSEWIVQTAWGWRDGEDTPELLVAWDFFSFEQNEVGFREEVTQKFGENAIRMETLRIVRLRIDGDAIRALYDHAEVPALVEGVT